MKDLVVLVPDKNTEETIRALLQSRQEALGIRPLSFDVFVHPRRDPGVYREASEFLRPYQSQYRHALVIFDRDFAGGPASAPKGEKEVQDKLDQEGWQGRSAVVIIDPDLEAWVFSGSRHVVEELANGDEGLFQQVIAQYVASSPQAHKPQKPKEAMEELLRTFGIPRASAIYSQLAKTVSLRHCQDAAFGKLRSTLQTWFPLGEKQ